MAKVTTRHAWAAAIVLPALYAMGTGALALTPVGSQWMARITAAGLVMCGMGLLAAMRDTPAARRLRFACGAAVLAVAGAATALLAFDAPWLDAVSPATAFLFATAGLVLCTFDLVRNRLDALLIQLLVGLVLAVALVSLIAQDVNPEGLLPWYRWSGGMRQATAIAFVAIGTALLAHVAASASYRSVYEGREDEKILVVAMGILSLVAVAMGAAAFVSMQLSLERSVHGALTQAVGDRAAAVQSAIDLRIAQASFAASRPVLLDALRGVSTSPAVRERVAAEAAGFLASGFNGLVVYDARGAPLAQVGVLAPESALEVPFEHRRARAALLWSGAFVLRVWTPIWEGGGPAGTVMSEHAMGLLTRLQLEDPELGESAEWMLCGPRGDRMACFPSRFAHDVEVLDRRPGGVPEPMDFALEQRKGVVFAADYRGERVVAGYAPVGDTGLGVELKMRQDEFYAPLRRELGLWWRWYFALALAGAVLVASQVRPVARRLVRSEATARERAETLARSERALRDLYASLADGIVVLTGDGLIEFANPAAARILGCPASELAGRPLASFIVPGHDLSAAIDAGTLVFPAVRRDGSRFDAELSIARMPQAERPRLVAVLRDVSERTALERLKHEFTAAVSHELRTPLTSVIGSLEILREEAKLEEPERELLDMACRNSERLAKLVNDVIDIARLEAGALRFEPARFALEGFLEEAVSLDQAYAAAHAATLRLETPVPDATLLADRDRLMQVMANLLSNAAKFSPHGGEVLVRAAMREGYVRVEVCDRGRGIPEAFKARIFQKFAQADSTDSREKGGTGLGLAICKGIVERLGGTIGFEDRAGGGTVFWFELPA